LTRSLVPGSLAAGPLRIYLPALQHATRIARDDGDVLRIGAEQAAGSTCSWIRWVAPELERLARASMTAEVNEHGATRMDRTMLTVQPRRLNGGEAEDALDAQAWRPIAGDDRQPVTKYESCVSGSNSFICAERWRLQRSSCCTRFRSRTFSSPRAGSRAQVSARGGV
jgi:hypothetical protein